MDQGHASGGAFVLMLDGEHALVEEITPCYHLDGQATLQNDHCKSSGARIGCSDQGPELTRATALVFVVGRHGSVWFRPLILASAPTYRSRAFTSSGSWRGSGWAPCGPA